MLCEALTRSFYITANDDIVEVTDIHPDNITVRPWQPLATAEIKTSVVRKTIICDQPEYSTNVQALEIHAIAQCDSIINSDNRLAMIVRGIRPVNIAKVTPSLFQKRSDVAFFTDGGYRSAPLSEELLFQNKLRHSKLLTGGAIIVDIINRKAISTFTVDIPKQLVPKPEPYDSESITVMAILMTADKHLLVGSTFYIDCEGLVKQLSKLPDTDNFPDEHHAVQIH